MENKRFEIFNQLRAKLRLEDKAIDLVWCTDLQSMKGLVPSQKFENEFICMDFGTCLIFDGLELKLSAQKLTSQGTKFSEVGGVLNTNKEAKNLYLKLEAILGKPDYFSESNNEIFTHWEDEFTKIEIYPRHHLGGEWFEYRIKTKQCV